MMPHPAKPGCGRQEYSLKVYFMGLLGIIAELDTSLVDGAWIFWCDGNGRAAEIAEEIQAQGFQVRLVGERVYVLATEGDRIPTS